MRLKDAIKVTCETLNNNPRQIKENLDFKEKTERELFPYPKVTKAIW